MKYKPAIWGITREVDKLKNPNLTALSGILETALFLGSAYHGYLVYSCGNPKCGKAFEPFKSTAQRPLVCPKCGEEIAWEHIATRKIKVCPECNHEYGLNDNYCPYHIPKVALVEKEIPL
jgi:DNA-directed RNA polymerase subunit RPC12/RpoP